MSVGRWLAPLRARPGRVLVALLTVTLALGAFAPFTPWDDRPELLALEGSGALRDYRAFLERFGSDELVVVALEDPALLEPAGLGRVRALTRAFEAIPGVERVWSLDTAYAVDVGPFGPFARPLLPEDLQEAPPPEALARRIRRLPVLRESALDASGTVTTLAVKPEGRALGREERALQQRVLAGIEAVLSRPAYHGLEVHLAGSPVFNRELQRLNARDQALFTPLALALAAGLLWIALRSAALVGLALACVLATLAWIRGAMTLLGIPLHTTTSLLAPLLVVLSVSVAVHVLARYRRERSRRHAAAALRAAEEAVALPAALTALTTAAGFGSLVVSPVPGIRAFGALAGAGALAAFVLGAVGLPAALRWLGPVGRASAEGDRVDALLGALRRLARRRAGAVLAGSAALALAAALALPGLRISTHDADFFPADHPLNRAYRFIESRLAGVTPLEVLVDTGEAGGVRRPEIYALLRDLQAFLGRQPETVRGTSVVDWIDEARRALAPEAGGEAPEADEIERAAFVLEAVAAGDLDAWVQDEWRVARLSSRSVALDSAENAALLGRLRDFAEGRSAGLDGVSVAFTGLVPVFARMEEALLDAQIRSFALALACIFAVFAALFRSLRLAVLAMLPNVFPILLTLGAMSLLGVPLDVVTVMVASVSLGIVVDDTLHLLHAVRGELAAGRPLEEAVDRALASVGRALVFTSVVLAGGFGVLALSDFRPTAHFGALTAFTMATALAADLVLLPALLRVAAPFATAGGTRVAWREAA